MTYVKAYARPTWPLGFYHTDYPLLLCSAYTTLRILPFGALANKASQLTHISDYTPKPKVHTHVYIHTHAQGEREREREKHSGTYTMPPQRHTQCQGAQIKTKNKGVTLANGKKPHQMSNVQDIVNKEAKF